MKANGGALGFKQNDRIHDKGVALVELALMIVIIAMFVIAPIVLFAPSFTGDNVDVLALDAMNSLQPRDYMITALSEEGFVVDLGSTTVDSILDQVISEVAVRSETDPADWCARLLFIQGAISAQNYSDVELVGSRGASCSTTPTEMLQSFFATSRTAEIGLEALNQLDQYAIGLQNVNPRLDRWVIYPAGTRPGF